MHFVGSLQFTLKLHREPRTSCVCVPMSSELQVILSGRLSTSVVLTRLLPRGRRAQTKTCTSRTVHISLLEDLLKMQPAAAEDLLVLVSPFPAAARSGGCDPLSSADKSVR